MKNYYRLMRNLGYVIAFYPFVFFIAFLIYSDIRVLYFLLTVIILIAPIFIGAKMASYYSDKITMENNEK